MAQVDEISEGEYHAREFIKRLREESVNKSDPLPEWTTPKLCVTEFEDTAGCYCICKKKIQNVYEIFNINTDKRLEIGCDCAERWFKAKYVCEKCKSPLGNVKKRMAEQNFICPKCAREQIALQKAQQKERETLEAKYFNTCFCNLTKQPWLFSNYPHNRIFRLIDNPEWCNFVLNMEISSLTSSYQAYIGNLQKLIRLTWDVQTS